MTTLEFSKIVAALKTVYTSPNFIPNEQAIEVWFTLIGKNTDYKTVAVAAQMYMTTERFPPTPSDILKNIAKLTKGEEYPNEQEAWAAVSKACSNGNYGAREEFDRLPPVIRRAVGAPDTIRDWANVEGDAFQTVIQSNFLRSYRAALQSQREMDSYSPKLQEIIKKALPQKDAKERAALLPPQAEMVEKLQKDNKKRPPSQLTGDLGEWIKKRKRG